MTRVSRSSLVSCAIQCLLIEYPQNLLKQQLKFKQAIWKHTLDPIISVVDGITMRVVRMEIF